MLVVLEKAVHVGAKGGRKDEIGVVSGRGERRRVLQEARHEAVVVVSWKQGEVSSGEGGSPVCDLVFVLACLICDELLVMLENKVVFERKPWRSRPVPHSTPLHTSSATALGE